MVKSVRLACLMCAASVYPEPGSNSHVISIYIYISLCNYISFLFRVFDSFFYAFAFFYFGSFTTALLVSQSLLFTFQCAFIFLNSVVVWNVFYFTILKNFCQYFFYIFLNFFICLFLPKKCKIIN